MSESEKRRKGFQLIHITYVKLRIIIREEIESAHLAEQVNYTNIWLKLVIVVE